MRVCVCLYEVKWRNFSPHRARHLQLLQNSLVIHATLTAARGRLDIPHPFTHSCLAKMKVFFFPPPSDISDRECLPIALWCSFYFCVKKKKKFSWSLKGLNIFARIPKADVLSFIFETIYSRTTTCYYVHPVPAAIGSVCDFVIYIFSWMRVHIAAERIRF